MEIPEPSRVDISAAGRHLPELDDVVVSAYTKRQDPHAARLQLPCGHINVVERTTVRHDNRNALTRALTGEEIPSRVVDSAPGPCVAAGVSDVAHDSE